MGIATINPATGETVSTFKALSDHELEGKLRRAVEAFSIQTRRSFSDRAARMHKTAELLEARAADYGRMITIEMGKPVNAAIAEVKKCSWVCHFYAENAESQLADEVIATDADRSYIRYQPLGPILAVMPWNFPFWQVFRFAAPALMAGNVGLLKHSSNVPQSALAIEEVLRDGGFDQGEFQALLIGSERVQALLDDDRIKAATLTGSEGAGASVAAIAGKQIKKTVLELGGSDPFIVMPSADLDEAVKWGVKARTVNNGQSCIAAKRFVLHESIAEEFETKFVAAMAALRVGDPLDESTEIGPLATPDILEDLDRQVRECVQAGARILTGGTRIGTKGNFYAPTVLTGLQPESAPAQEETFGPIATLFRVRDFDQAVAVANATSFGLASSVWTGDADEAARFIDAIDAGQVFVNAMVASDPRLPFGGIKRSGFGRELGTQGIREFMNAKTVYVMNQAARHLARGGATE